MILCARCLAKLRSANQARASGGPPVPPGPRVPRADSSGPVGPAAVSPGLLVSLVSVAAAVVSRALSALTRSYSLIEVHRAAGLRNRVVVEVLGDESVLRAGRRKRGRRHSETGDVWLATQPNTHPRVARRRVERHVRLHRDRRRSFIAFLERRVSRPPLELHLEHRVRLVAPGPLHRRVQLRVVHIFENLADRAARFQTPEAAAVARELTASPTPARAFEPRTFRRAGRNGPPRSEHPAVSAAFSGSSRCCAGRFKGNRVSVFALVFTDARSQEPTVCVYRRHTSPRATTSACAAHRPPVACSAAETQTR